VTRRPAWMLETSIVEDRPRSLSGAAEATATRRRESVEEVVTCADCGAKSTMDVGGRDAFGLRIRGLYVAVFLCPPCWRADDPTPQGDTK